jgi:hypothetical protein
MSAYDLFNGDADGICSLQQLRLHQPKPSTLITGIKRDINLFAQIDPQQGDDITALDISFDKNREGVQRALDKGARIFYADHHYPGELIDHDHLELHIQTDSNACTSLIINEHLHDRYYAWAIAGAYGDNLYDSAEALASRFDLSGSDREALKKLGTCINYNGYGFTVDDLIFHPAALFKLLQPCKNPLDFVHSDDYHKLSEAYDKDLGHTHELLPVEERHNGAVYILPDQPWSRRVNGVFSNDLARATTSRAHAVLVACGAGCYRVSVRAPLDNKTGADELCRQFESGGGRQAAAGINQLSEAELPRFMQQFFESF